MDAKMQDFKLAVVGNPSSILLYRAIGVETHAVKDSAEAATKTEELFTANLGDENKTAQYAIVFVEEDFYKNFSEDLLIKMSNKPLPAVVPVPVPRDGGDGFALKRLRKIVERAIGSDIMG